MPTLLMDGKGGEGGHGDSSDAFYGDGGSEMNFGMSMMEPPGEIEMDIPPFEIPHGFGNFGVQLPASLHVLIRLPARRRWNSHKVRVVLLLLLSPMLT